MLDACIIAHVTQFSHNLWGPYCPETIPVLRKPNTGDDISSLMNAEADEASTDLSSDKRKTTRWRKPEQATCHYKVRNRKKVK